MDNTKKIIISAVAVAVVAVLAGVAIQKGWLKPLLQIGVLGPGAGPGAGRSTNAPATGLPTIEGGTRDVISESVKTPEPGQVSAGSNVAIPKSSIELGGGGGASASLRDFEIKAENNRFTPSTIVVNEMDVITITLTAVDAKYNIFFPDFGAYKEAAKGQTVKFQFQAYPYGEYKFYCKDICSSATAGTLIVNKK